MSAARKRSDGEPSSMGAIIAGAGHVAGVEIDPEAAPLHRCEGGCGAAVARRRGWCDPCAESSRKAARELALAPACRSVSPDGALDWCRVGLPAYANATAKARERATRVGKNAIDLVFTATWKRAWGSLLLLGPTGIGKTTIIVAIAHRMLDAAAAGGLDESYFHAAMRIRFVDGIELSKAEKKHKLGDGQDAALIAEAKRASLLLLDEIGYEDQKFDPHAVRDVLMHRSRMGLPSLITSGRERTELDTRYGAALLRRITEPGRGHVFDLHGGP